jgi:hypothetical protein
MSLADFHIADETAFYGINMLHYSIQEYLSSQIANDLVNADHYTPRFIEAETLWLDMRVHCMPLPRPVFADARMPVNCAALHAIGPLHIATHGRQSSINVPGVECLIRLPEQCHLGFVDNHAAMCLYALTRNFPSRIICSSSTQILNFRPTTSI